MSLAPEPQPALAPAEREPLDLPFDFELLAVMSGVSRYLSPNSRVADPAERLRLAHEKLRLYAQRRNLGDDWADRALERLLDG